MSFQRLKNQTLAKLFTAFPMLAANWGKRLSPDGREVPWARPRVSLCKARLALVTTGGVHLRSQAPFDMTDPNGDPSVREVPVATATDELVITHDYYDHRDAEQDLNLVFPVERLTEWADNIVLTGSATTAVAAPRGGAIEVDRLTNSFETLVAQVAEQNRELKRRQYELKEYNAHR